MLYSPACSRGGVLVTNTKSAPSPKNPPSSPIPRVRCVRSVACIEAASGRHPVYKTGR